MSEEREAIARRSFEQIDSEGNRTQAARKREAGATIETAGQRVVQEWEDAWNAHDVERILACFTEDAVYEDVPTGTVNRTHEEARQFIEAGWAAFPDLRFELTDLSVIGERGTSEWTMMGTHEGDFPGLPATGKAMSVRGVSVLELSENKIRAVRDYYDFATLLRELGILDEPA